VGHEIEGTEVVHYQPASGSVLVRHGSSISRYTYRARERELEFAKRYGPIDELQGAVVLLEDLVELECILVVAADGSIFTIDREGEVDIKAQNEDGITAATLSPTQEYIYLVTKNKSLIQLNAEFDLVNEIPLDENEEVVDSPAQFSWRTDGNFFILNYRTVNGHKAVTRDLMMSAFISPAKSDPTEEGLVQSVSEKGREKMSGLVAWQPSGSIAAATDYVLEGERKKQRVIFWEKNGLRHLQFELPLNVVQVTHLLWSADSIVLYVQVVREQG
jgi:elongator complex protein 1